MILGAIIAGGQSGRFGSDKALAMIAGRPMIEHIVGKLTPAVDAVVVCGRSYGNLVSLPDRPGPGLGPLAGFAAAFHYAMENGFEAVLTLPCDTPTVSADLIGRIANDARPSFLANCPVIGIWPSSAGGLLDSYIATDARRSVRKWAQSINARQLCELAPTNVNYASDLSSIHD